MWRVGFQAVQFNAFDLKQGRAADGVAGLVEISGDFGLAVDGDGPARVTGKADVHLIVVEGQYGAIVSKPFACEPVAHASALHQFDHALFQHTCTDTAQDMRTRLAFQNDGIDPILGQQLRQ